MTSDQKPWQFDSYTRSVLTSICLQDFWESARKLVPNVAQSPPSPWTVLWPAPVATNQSTASGRASLVLDRGQISFMKYLVVIMNNSINQIVDSQVLSFSFYINTESQMDTNNNQVSRTCSICAGRKRCSRRSSSIHGVIHSCKFLT